MNRILLSLAAASCIAIHCHAAEPATASGIDRNNMDTASRVQDDLFRNVNGKWLDTTEIPADKPVKAKAGAQTLVVVRRGKDLDALHDVCAHQGCSLSDGKIVGDAIECPCHGSRYRLHDGLVVRGPAVFDQPHYEVREAEGKLEVRRTDTR